MALLREFERSGLTMAEFCRRREVSYSTMAAWRRSFRERTGAFVEVEPLKSVAPAAARSTGSLCSELMLRGGAVLRVWQILQNGERTMIFTCGLRVWLAAQPADLRRRFEGMALQVRQAQGGVVAGAVRFSLRCRPG